MVSLLTLAGSGKSLGLRNKRHSRNSRNRSRRRTCRTWSCNRGRKPPRQRRCIVYFPDKHTRRCTARTRTHTCPPWTTRHCSECQRGNCSRHCTGSTRTQRHRHATTRDCIASPKNRRSPRCTEWAHTPACPPSPRQRCNGSRCHTRCPRRTGSPRTPRLSCNAGPSRNYSARTYTAGAGIGRCAHRSAGTSACTRYKSRRFLQCNPCPRCTPPGTAGYSATTDNTRAPSCNTRPSTRWGHTGRSPRLSDRRCRLWVVPCLCKSGPHRSKTRRPPLHLPGPHRLLCSRPSRSRHRSQRRRCRPRCRQSRHWRCLQIPNRRFRHWRGPQRQDRHHRCHRRRIFRCQHQFRYCRLGRYHRPRSENQRCRLPRQFPFRHCLRECRPSSQARPPCPRHWSRSRLRISRSR